uniref:Uncharacterized protein n=1 Tax=Trichuris muris TaxID=70415 RepID=A0A5S6R3X7_TRIMR
MERDQSVFRSIRDYWSSLTFNLAVKAGINGRNALKFSVIVLEPLHRLLDAPSVRGCLLWESRVVIPKKVQRSILEVLHQAHPGMARMEAHLEATCATASSPAEILLRRRPKSLQDNLHLDLLTSAVKAQEEDAINLAERSGQKAQSFKESDKVWARKFQAHSTGPTGVVQEVIYPQSYWVELPLQNLRWRRSIDHLRSRAFEGATELADGERRTAGWDSAPEPVRVGIPEKEAEPGRQEPFSKDKEPKVPCVPPTPLVAPGATKISLRGVAERRPVLQTGTTGADSSAAAIFRTLRYLAAEEQKKQQNSMNLSR